MGGIHGYFVFLSYVSFRDVRISFVLRDCDINKLYQELKT